MASCMSERRRDEGEATMEAFHAAAQVQGSTSLLMGGPAPSVELNGTHTLIVMPMMRIDFETPRSGFISIIHFNSGVVVLYESCLR